MLRAEPFCNTNGIATAERFPLWLFFAKGNGVSPDLRADFALCFVHPSKSKKFTKILTQNAPLKRYIE